MKTGNFKLLFLCVCLSAVAGFLGWKNHRVQKVDSISEVSSSEAERSLTKKREASFIQKIRSARSEAERLRMTIAMARTIPVTKIPALIRKPGLSLGEGFASTLFRNLLLERWAAEKPVEFARWALDHEPKIHEQKIVEFMKAQPDAFLEILGARKPSHRFYAELALAAREAPDLALEELGRRLPFDDDDSRHYEKVARLLMQNRPEEFRELLARFDGIAMERVLFQEDFKNGVPGILEKAFEHRAGLNLLTSDGSSQYQGPWLPLLERVPDFPDAWRQTLATQTWRITPFLKEGQSLLDLDLEAMGFSPEQSRKIEFVGLIREMQNNPVKAIGWFREFDLSPEQKTVLFQDSIRSVNAGEVDIFSIRNAIQVPADLKHFDELNEAAGENETFAQKQSQRMEIKTPAQFESALKKGSFKYLLEVTMNWDQEQIADLARAFEDFDEETKQKLATMALTNGSSAVPTEIEGVAVEYLLSNPGFIDRDGWGGESTRDIDYAASEHAVALMRSNPAEAAEWVDSLPEGKSRLWGKINLALNWQNYDSTASKAWIARQPEAERKAIKTHLERGY